MKYLITGGCGFLGSNLAVEVLKKRKELVIFDNLYRYGSSKNLEWLKSQGKFQFVHADIRNASNLERVIKNIKPDVIFHLAGQVAMTTSIKNPRIDFEINALGTFNLLEAVRKYAPKSIVIYSSTNKVYGDLEWVRYEETKTRYIAVDFPNGFPETIPLDFHSSYGCSKGAADQYMLDYGRMFGLRTVVFRHSSIYGDRQFPTYDQGWVGWFCLQALKSKQGKLKEPLTISGNGKQVRDVLHAKDIKRLYFDAITNIDQIKSQAFNIGGGIKNSLSLLELIALLKEILNVKLKYNMLQPRESDQKFFVANTDKANRLLKWTQLIDPEEGVKNMLIWLLESKI